MPKLRDPKTGVTVTCEGDLAKRYQSRGWVTPEDFVALGDEAELEEVEGEASADDVAPEEPAAEDEPAADDAKEEKPATRSSARRK